MHNISLFIILLINILFYVVYFSHLFFFVSFIHLNYQKYLFISLLQFSFLLLYLYFSLSVSLSYLIQLLKKNHINIHLWSFFLKNIEEYRSKILFLLKRMIIIWRRKFVRVCCSKKNHPQPKEDPRVCKNRRVRGKITCLLWFEWNYVVIVWYGYLP